MKLNTKTDSQDGDSKDNRPEWMSADRPDRAVSREELCRLLAGGKPAAAVETKVLPLSWLDKVAAWISALLWRRTVIGYQDENGFHYGVPPANKETHATGD